MDLTTAATVDLSGRWAGFYRYQSEQWGEFPITANLLQDGQRLFGEMWDGVTQFNDSLENLTEKYRGNYSLWEKFLLKLTRLSYGKGTVTVESRVPSVSDLSGSVEGTSVNFTKQYRGRCEAKWLYKRTMYGARSIAYQVIYTGQFSREPDRLEGEWIIRRPTLFGNLRQPAARGTFQLQRISL